MAAHPTMLNPSVLERVMKRRGTLTAFDHIDPKRTALVAVDMQRWILDPTTVTAVPSGTAIIGPTNRAAAALREAGGLVVWVKMVASDDSIRDWGVFFDGIVANRRDTFIESFRLNSYGVELHDDVDVRAEDLISEKTRYSSILPHSSDLDARLRDRGIDTLIIAGAVTNVCCESTARDAMMMGYRVVMLADACAAQSDDDHNASLSNLINMFADIRETDAFIGMLKQEPNMGCAPE